MKILIINTTTTGKNGITNVIFNYIKAINGSEIVFDLVSRNQPEQLYVDAIEQKGGRVYYIDKFGSLLKYIWQLSRLIKRNKYDAVHIHGNSHTICIELIGAWLGRCKKRIVHAHNTSCKSLVAHKTLTGLFNVLCTHGFACGKAAGEFMFGNNPFVVINNGVDTDKFAFRQHFRDMYRKEWNVDDNTFVIGHVGSFIKAKNHEHIIRVFDALSKKADKYRLIMIGDGELKKTIAEETEMLGLQDKVLFTGNINNVHEVINAIDVILMPSFFEGLPLTLIEQQANGLKCVVSDNITHESDKTGNLCFLSLNDPINEWVNAVETQSVQGDRNIRSKDAIKSITESGYSIQEQAAKLKQEFLKILKK